jgi:predicted DCC family thiol-disulfide oxidoreductase YuxK
VEDALPIQNDQAPPGRAERAQVFYDGLCPFCLKSVAILKKLDWLHRLTYVNARELRGLSTGQSPLDPSRLLDEMHLVAPDGGRVYHGFGAFRWMAWRLPLLWPLAPLLYIPGVPALGQRLYLWVARNRFQLVPCHGGICALSPRPSPAAQKPAPRPDRRKATP